MITVTVEILRRNVLLKDLDGIGKSVMANCDSFQGCDNDVDCVEKAGSSRKSTAGRRKLYKKGSRIPMDNSRL